MKTVKLPKGITVHVKGQKYSGSIPENLCPKKYLGDKTPEVKNTKPEVKNAQPEGTGGK